jgi:protoheme IX farnesyltransferase
MTDATITLTTDSRVSDFIALLKPRVMSLVVFTGAVGLALAPGHLHPLLAAIAIFCIAVGAGAAGTINMWYERDVDALMHRTRGRPLPMGRIQADEALTFGIVLTLFSVVLLGLATNWVAAFWLAFANAFYVFVYTLWLKRRTPQNIVIGGAAGAFPPIIGWAAVTGTVPLEAWSLFALIFFWTPPHFWALALYRSEDYARAGIPMLPVVKGEAHTKLQIMLYSLLLLPLSLTPYITGIAGPLYVAAALPLSLIFLGQAIAVYRDKTHASARRLFKFSIFYLAALFAALLIEGLI